MTTDDPTLSFITPRVAAGVLFTDDQDRILMVVPTYKDYYDIPGGYVEHGETPYQAAQREVHEELGIKPPIGRLLVADWWQESPENENGPKLLLIFDGDCLSSQNEQAILVEQDEIAEFKYCDPTELDNVTIPRLANRLRESMSARQNSSVQYLENGVAVLRSAT